MIENKIHVAYGFHVNCYHSYRGDTNDNLGFGSDIRIIRKILDTLTEFNEQGIPVKGTWDTENFFSLQKILPEYAPDIIEKMKERVEKYGDENIIMGYNNGALSAMTEDEFCESINLAITNPDGSGLNDIFGTCEKIVRPQEVMFTPSQVSLYNKLGIKALCLYYSCVPFDAFRTIIPRLSDEEAFNPLTYTYNGESMTIIPTYSNSDVCDAGCLRAWVKDLRKKQESGEINNDLFLFINMDADAIFWETIDLGKFTGKVANTDGIHGLVAEIADLPYIIFDFESVKKTIDIMGGILFTPKMSFKAKDSLGRVHNFQKGKEMLLDGEASLSFMRHRASLTNQDLDRCNNQKDLMMAVMKKYNSLSRLDKIKIGIKVYSLIKTNVKYNDIFPLLKIDFDKYEKNTYTLKGKSIYDHGYYYVLDKEYLKKMKGIIN